MERIEPSLTVGNLVRQKPSRSRVFDQLGIDFCCGGKVSLQRACEKRGLAVASVVAQLAENDTRGIPGDHVDADAMRLTELCDHIEATHHAYLKQELPRLGQMTEKVARVHSDKEPKLQEIRQIFVELRAEMEPHMLKEEKILFPMIRQLEASVDLPKFHCGTLENPIRQMEHEHDQAGDALARIRVAADDFIPPEWACNTYRAMLDGLRHLDGNMHQHVHKENNVLFPKAAELEASRALKVASS